MTGKEIAAKLYAYYVARDEAVKADAYTKELHKELMQIAIDLGGDERDVMNGSAKHFLDGYLVAHGIVPEYREIARIQKPKESQQQT